MRLLKAILLPYRSVDTLEFELGPFTVLFGKNNAGKTNILEALYGVLAPHDMPGRGHRAVAPARSIRGGEAPIGALYVELEQGLPFDDEVLSTDDPDEAKPLVVLDNTGTTLDGEPVTTIELPCLPPCQVAFVRSDYSEPGLLFADPREYFRADWSCRTPDQTLFDQFESLCIDGPRPRPVFLDWEFEDINERVGSAILRPLIDGGLIGSHIFPGYGWLEPVGAASPPGAWRVRPEIDQLVAGFATLATDFLPDFVDGSIRAQFHVPTKWGESPWVSVEYVERGTGQRADSVADIGRGAARWIAASTQIAQHLLAHAREQIPSPNPQRHPTWRSDEAGPKPWSGHVLFVDEPEAHLHPFAVASIVRWCRRMVELGFNVVVASHHEEFLRASGDDVTFVEVTRDLEHSHTRARTLLSAATPLLQDLAIKVGMHPAVALSLLRAILFVEGPLDEAVLAEFAGPQLDAAGVLVIPIHGTRNLEGLIDGELAPRFGINVGILTDATDAATMRSRSNKKRSREEIWVSRLIKRFEDRGRRPPTAFGVPEDDLLFALPAEAIREYFNGSFPGWHELREECRAAEKLGASDSVDWKSYAQTHYGLPITSESGVRSLVRALDLKGVELPSIRAVVDEIIDWAKEHDSTA